jgi:protoporphyrinogen oxidase
MLKFDFVIVGAGIGGLYLGNYLEKQKKSYLIIESRSGMGGRIQTCSVDGISFELGAARILSNHYKALSIIEKLGLEIEEQHSSDSPVYWENKWYASQDEIVDFNQYPNPISLFEEILSEYSILDLASFQSFAPKEWDKMLTRTWLEQKGIPYDVARLFFLGDIDVNLEQITLYESLFFYLINLIDK